MSYCEMWCPEGVVPATRPGDEDTKGMCDFCAHLMEFLCREVLPSIGKHGYWAPDDSDADEEFQELVNQSGLQGRLQTMLRQIGFELP